MGGTVLVIEDEVDLAATLEYNLRSEGYQPRIAQKLQMFKGAGCRTCSNTGYKGRIAIYEVMPFTDALKELVLQGASTAEVKAEAIRGGMKSLRMSGIEKLIAGITTVEEVLRVSVAD